MQKILILCASLTLLALPLTAQEFSGGFKAGLNFSNFNGETLPNETYSWNTGFHIAATFFYSITDLFGLKGELMYSQKGVKYNYEGPSYFAFYNNNGARQILTGTRRTDISIANSYMDIPVLAYFRLGRVELEAGINGSFLIGSRGSGGITFEGSGVERFTTSAEFGFLTDDTATPTLDPSGKFVLIQGAQYIQPERIGAYYESADDKARRFNRFDVGLNAGASFFLNSGLYVGIRANYGLLDVTNAKQDIDPTVEGPNETFVTRDDEDKNISLQASVGFRF